MCSVNNFNTYNKKSDFLSVLCSITPPPDSPRYNVLFTFLENEVVVGLDFDRENQSMLLEMLGKTV